MLSMIIKWTKKNVLLFIRLIFFWQKAEEEEPITNVKMEACIEFFDRRFLAISWFELREVMAAIRRVNIAHSVLHGLSAECRVNGISLAAAQVARVSKICDVLDAIPRIPFPNILASEPFAGSPSVKIWMDLPDVEVFTAYISKLRGKLKPLDEMVSSKKNDGIRFQFSSSSRPIALHSSSILRGITIFDTSLLRREVQELYTALDNLESSLPLCSDVLQHILLIREQLHRPYLNLRQTLLSLPPLEEVEVIVKNEAATFAMEEERYTSLCQSNPVLQEAATVQDEMQSIIANITQVIEQQHMQQQQKQQQRQLSEFVVSKREALTSSSGAVAFEILSAILNSSSANNVEESLSRCFLKYRVVDTEQAIQLLSSLLPPPLQQAWTSYPFANILSAQAHVLTLQNELQDNNHELQGALNELQVRRAIVRKSLLQAHRAAEHYRQLLIRHEQVAQQLHVFQESYRVLCEEKLGLSSVVIELS